MEILAERLAGSYSKFQLTTRGHRLVCDQPVENGGEDAGMTPPELFLAGIASCAAYYASQYLKTRALTVDHLSVRVSAAKASNPARLASFRIEVNAPGLDPRHEAPFLRAVEACLLHRTLLGQPSVEIALNTAVPA